ncbi:MAG: DUF2336 domain-containing protein [Tagaea sp.]
MDPSEYESAKRMLNDSDVFVRSNLARRTDLRPELLYYLTDDSSAEVRQALADNSALPWQADMKLAGDSSVDVRAGLAGKVQRILPGLQPGEQDAARQRIMKTLEVLAKDTAARVRGVVAETLKDVADAPPELVKQLARDAELAVSAPVLQFSPLLTDEDLIEIVKGKFAEGATSVVARRAGVSERLSDAIVQSDDIEAVATLLGNSSAQIREETLDLVLDKAPARPSWHGPLVDRPQLSNKAALKIAAFVAEAFAQRLQARPDLDPATKEAVTAEVRKRIAEAGGGVDDTTGLGKKRNVADPDWAAGGGEGEGETVGAKVKRLRREKKLDDASIVAAAQGGEKLFVKLALAELAAIRAEAVDKILTARSAKGVIAVCWKAKLKLPTAVAIQQRTLSLPPKNVLNQPKWDGWPMTEEELKWQLEFFGA